MTKAPRQCNGRVIALLKRVKSPASRALSLWASVEEKASWGFWRHVQRLGSCKNSGGEKENWGGRAVFSSPGNLGNPRQDDSCHLAASPATCCRETFQCASLSLYIASTREMDRTQGAGYTPLCTVINICASVLFTHCHAGEETCQRGGGLLHTTTQVQYFFPLPASRNDEKLLAGPCTYYPCHCQEGSSM